MKFTKVFAPKIFALLLMIPSYFAVAQVDPTTRYNENSVRPIRKDDQMFKKSLWFQMDLRTKKNAPFFAQNNELPRLIIDAAKKGLLQPYYSDSLATTITKEEFLERLRIPQADREEDLLLASSEDDWGSASGGEKKRKPVFAPDQDEYLPKQLFRIEIKEDLIFDKRRSRMYHDIQAITIIIPGEVSATGVDKVLASFSYKELYDKLFHIEKGGKKYDNPDAIWFNPQNPAEHRNLSEAFDLRLFESRLVKYENPKNSHIEDLYENSKRALIHSEEAVYQLMEYEALLWSY
jgi:gliding motility associated protien GldN